MGVSIRTISLVFVAAIFQRHLFVSAQTEIGKGCIPGRCSRAAVNKRDVSDFQKRSGPPTSDVPKATNPEVKKMLMEYVRHDKKQAPIFEGRNHKGVKDQYTAVLFNPDAEGDNSIKKKYSKHITSVVTSSDYTIFNLKCDYSIISQLCEEQSVAYIEHVQKAAPSTCGQQDLVTDDGLNYDVSWGISRVDERDPVPDGTYNYDNTPAQEDVYLYVMDTGVKANTNEYGTRLQAVTDVSGANNALDDANGHGTHVCGTAGSMTYGVAKNVKLFSARISNDLDGNSDSALIIQALQNIIVHVTTNNKENRAVINISFGGEALRSMNLKIAEVLAAGITVVTSAGNDGDDACCHSPSSATGVITVGCMTFNNDFCSFSNWGSCVDILAPGLFIGSLDLDGTRTESSGTSMSAPHVAGVAAILIARNMPTGLTPAQVKTQILSTATTDLMNVNTITHRHITPSKVIYLNCEA